MKPILKDFSSFLFRQNALALAVGVIIGAAVGRVVTGLVEDLVMPLVGLVLPGGNWRSAQLAIGRGNALKYGDFFGRCVDFLIVAGVVYLITRIVLREKPKSTRQCPECLEQIPLEARRCRACTAVISGVVSRPSDP